MTFPEAYELMQTQWVLCEYNGLLYRRTIGAVRNKSGLRYYCQDHVKEVYS